MHAYWHWKDFEIIIDARQWLLGVNVFRDHSLRGRRIEINVFVGPIRFSYQHNPMSRSYA